MTDSTAGPGVRARGRQLERFVLYRALSRFYFHLPVLFVYLYTGGLSIPVIELLLAVYGLLIVLAAPLGGWLLQRLPLRTVVAAGEALKVVGVGLLALGPGLATALPGQVLGAVGYSLAASTDSTLLAGLTEGDRELYQRYEAKSAAAIFAAALVGGVTGAVLFLQDHALPFWASVVLSLTAFAIVLTIHPSRLGAGPAQRGPVPRLPRRQRFWLHYYAVTRAFILAPYVGFLPVLFFLALRVPVGWFGVILGIYGVTSFAVARWSRALAARLGGRRLGWASMTTCAVALLLLGLVPTLWGALLGVLGLGLGGGVVRPVALSNLDAAMAGWSQAQRRGLLSGQERLYGAWNTGILLAGGLVLDVVGIRTVLTGLALAYVVVLVVLGSLSR